MLAFYYNDLSGKSWIYSKGSGNLVQTIDSIHIDHQQLTDNSLNTILIVDKDQTILYCNKSFLELFEASEEDVLNKSVCCFIPSYQHKMCEELLVEMFTKQVTIEPKDMKMKKNSGEIIEVEMMCTPYFIEGNISAQIIMRSMTSRKVTEKLLCDSEKLASIGQLAAGIAHEIKNPLTSVKGFIQLLKESYPHHYLDMMESELNNALNTLHNLLQVSRPDLPDEPLVPIDVSMELSSLLPLFQEKLYSIKIEMDIKDSGIFIVGKKNLLLKAFFNLIKNAIEAIEGNGKIKIKHFFQDGWIHIKLSDTGKGIPPENVEMLGTPFLSTKTNGTGLGLTQVYRAIKEHEGIILVDSILGKGTTFHIQIPVKYSPHL
ncbi:two-component system sensor histidine kinase NtrB [Bacillus benzoevorans]|uniref:two-component system sensor histidine kinase NtrB n=1 Tax=Bacillus benzoevorans TaxID=1456 RepID=UPI001613CA49